MLLALGADIPAGVPVTSKQAWAEHLVADAWTVTRRCDAIDVTSYGDASPTYVMGLPETWVEFETTGNPGVEPGDLLNFDEDAAGFRITAQLRVQEITVNASVDGCVRWRVRACAVGAANIEMLSAIAIRPALSGLRGMDL